MLGGFHKESARLRLVGQVGLEPTMVKPADLQSAAIAARRLTRMEWMGRFELPTCCFGDSHSILLSYIRRLVSRWTKEFLEGGEAAFEPKPRPGNKFAALHRSKNLSEVERLRLLVAKQEIEIARLKKGYWVEGAGANKEYVTGQDANTKSSKN